MTSNRARKTYETERAAEIVAATEGASVRWASR